MKKPEQILAIVDVLERARGEDLQVLALYHLPSLLEVAKAHAGRKSHRLHSLEEWHEGVGDVLWWRFPISEPPYVGSPLDTEWPGYHTHWQRITSPSAPDGFPKDG